MIYLLSAITIVATLRCLYLEFYIKHVLEHNQVETLVQITRFRNAIKSCTFHKSVSRLKIDAYSRTCDKIFEDCGNDRKWK